MQFVAISIAVDTGMWIMLAGVYFFVLSCPLHENTPAVNIVLLILLVWLSAPLKT